MPASGTELDWGALAHGIPACLAVQVDGEFAYASTRLAELIDTPAENLVESNWRTLVDAPEATRLERDAFQTIRPTGSWTGRIQFRHNSEPTPVSLTALDDHTIVWLKADQTDQSSETTSQSPVPTTSSCDRGDGIVDTVADGIYALDADLRFSFVNDALCDLFGQSRESLLGTPVTEFMSDEDAAALAAEVRERVVTGDSTTGTVQAEVTTAEGTRVLEARYRLHPEPDGEYRGSVGVIRDLTDRVERERRIEEKLRELATLDRINELLLTTVRELVQTTSRTAVERIICERLTEADRYEFAWVGERELDGDGIQPREAAGNGGGYLDEEAIAAAHSTPDQGPSSQALQTGDLQVVEVADLPREAWRTAAADRGFRTIAAIPVQYNGTVYGVLVVYATDEDAFSPREQHGFDVLGRTVGAVIHAAQSRELLFADATVELEFRIEDDQSVFATITPEHDCRLDLDGYIHTDGNWLLYVTVTNAEPDAITDTAATDDRVERARTVYESASDGRVELVVADSPLLQTVHNAGGIVRTAAKTPDDASLVVEAPSDADIRDIVNCVQTEYADAALVARHRHERDLSTIASPASVLDGLTTRQQDAIEAAYRAGYFAWPRQSTAEEIADSLDIAAPTFHAHLRKAEHHILTALLDYTP